jgi:hypothetical protein
MYVCIVNDLQTICLVFQSERITDKYLHSFNIVYSALIDIVGNLHVYIHSIMIYKRNQIITRDSTTGITEFCSNMTQWICMYVDTNTNN